MTHRTNDDIATARRLAGQGHTAHQIATLMHVGVTLIRQWRDEGHLFLRDYRQAAKHRSETALALGGWYCPNCPTVWPDRVVMAQHRASARCGK